MFLSPARSFVYGFVCLLALSSLIMFVRSLVRSFALAFVVRSFVAAFLFLTFVRDVACCVLMLFGYALTCLAKRSQTLLRLAM